MKRITITALTAMALCSPMSAQDIYKVETFTGSDLTGTARFVGMGGAMSALGADISVMGQNPAGIGLYRKSDVALTGSVTAQPNAYDFCDINKARTSFDQAGFVYSCKVGGESLKYLNFGFNYQKRRNLKNNINLEGIPLVGGMSQSWQMMDLAYGSNGWLDLSTENGRGMTTPLACVGYDAQMIAPTRDADGKITGYEPSDAQSYTYTRTQWGGIQQYDFNVSFNVKNQIYGGVTLGVYNVDLHSGTYYGEEIIEQLNGGGIATHPYYMTNSEAITGTGFDLKFGLIFRPLEESPFRIGFSFSTPVFYDLTQSSYLYMNSPYAYTDDKGNQFDHTEADGQIGDYNYRIHTPWKVNISMGTTVGNFLALGAEYEVSRYTGAQVRYPDADDWGYVYSSSSRDKALDGEIDHFLKPVSTFRIGAEFRLAPKVYGRLGYNYVSSPFKKDAYLNLFTDSPSYYYSTNTDYVNLGDIHRATAGLGYHGKHFYTDVAYQFQRQQGDVYAFHVPEQNSEINRLQGEKVNLFRHNVMLTLGYKF